MTRVSVLMPFWDRRAKVQRAAGESFDADDGRAAEIAAILPGYVELSAAGDDLSGMTVAELRALADERGVTYPRNAGKAKLIGLLEEE